MTPDASDTETALARRAGTAVDTTPTRQLMRGQHGDVIAVEYRSRERLLRDAAVHPASIVTLVLVALLTFASSIMIIVAALVYAAVVCGVWMRAIARRVTPGTYAVRELTMSLPPTIRTRVKAVITTSDDIRALLANLPTQPTGIRASLDSLIITVFDTAHHLVQVTDSLGTIAAGQTDVIAQLEARRDGLSAQIDHVATSLDTIKAHVTKASVESSQPDDVAGEILALNDATIAMVAGMEEIRAIR